DEVNQYAAPMYAPTAGGAAAARRDRASEKISRINPAVATVSPIHKCPAERCVVDHDTAAWPNITLASTAPAIAPTSCAATYAGKSRALSPPPFRCPSHQSTAETTGLKWAPETGP